jgi:hypothetical protein
MSAASTLVTSGLKAGDAVLLKLGPADPNAPLPTLPAAGRLRARFRQGRRA